MNSDLITGMWIGVVCSWSIFTTASWYIESRRQKSFEIHPTFNIYAKNAIDNDVSPTEGR